MKNKLSSRNVRLEYYDNILMVSCREELEIDIDVVQEMTRLRKEISQGESCIACFDARNVRSISKEAREYASSNEGQEDVKAMAVLTDSHFTKLLSNFLIKIDFKKNDSKMPIKLFTTKEDALSWLKRYE